MAAEHILAIDQGTTSSRAIVFSAQGRAVASAQKELEQHFPRPGWVEHDAADIWTDTLTVCCQALARAREAAGLEAADIAAIGITNQRETLVAWDRTTGRPAHRAIVWQDRRGDELCRRLKAEGREALVQERTGLVLDPYFSASKAAWLMANSAQVRDLAAADRLALGTIDAWLIFNLSRVLSTEGTNASRTLLFNIHDQTWDFELLDLFGLAGLSEAALPRVLDCAADFGETDKALFGRSIPIRGVAGDQQAALVGQACFKPGMIKSTYGTGAFALLNTGAEAPLSRNRLLTTVAYRLDGQTTFALEGSIFSAGSAIQWLRDGLGLLTEAAESQARAEAVGDSNGVYLVPAFTGLGAPYWDASARGALVGLSRGTTANHLIRAALEAQGYQTRDLIEAMTLDSGTRPQVLRVDGGMAANDFVCQFLADILDIAVERPQVLETTALGAACLAGLGAGLFSSLDQAAEFRRVDRVFEPAMATGQREALYNGWLEAVDRVKTQE